MTYKHGRKLTLVLLGTHILTYTKNYDPTHLLTIFRKHKIVILSLISLGGIYHINATFMPSRDTLKPPTFKDVSAEGFEINLKDALDHSTITSLINNGVKVAHHAAIHCCSLFIYLASAKMSTIGPHGIEGKALQSIPSYVNVNGLYRSHAISKFNEFKKSI